MQKEAAAKMDGLLTSFEVTEAMKNMKGEQGTDTGEGDDIGQVGAVPRCKFIPGR